MPRIVGLSFEVRREFLAGTNHGVITSLNVWVRGDENALSQKGRWRRCRLILLARQEEAGFISASQKTALLSSSIHSM